MALWGDVFSNRQSLLLLTLARLGCEAGKRAETSMKDVLTLLFALALGRQADACSSLARWHTTREINTGAFGRQALGMVWDFCEINPFSGSSGGWEGVVQWIAKVCESQAEGDGHNSGRSSERPRPLTRFRMTSPRPGLQTRPITTPFHTPTFLITSTFGCAGCSTNLNRNFSGSSACQRTKKSSWTDHTL